MPTPTNAPSAGPTGRTIQNPELFNSSTERQEMPQASAAIKGLGKSQRFIIEKVGVIARARFLIKCTFETEATAATLAIGFPWRLIRSLSLEANGVTGIIDCSGMALEQRRRRLFRNPVKAVEVVPKVNEVLNASTKYEAVFALEVPIAHDMTSLIGALLAQNEETQLSLLVQWATEEEIVASGKILKFEGEVEWFTTTFSIGTATINKQEVTVLPDLTAFHGLLEEETPLIGTGERKTSLIRTDGQLLCLTTSVLNGPHAEITPASWTTHYLEYGGNKKPLVWTPASQLLELNADEYDGPLDINGVHFLAIDNETDNPQRDMIIPADLVELRAVVGIKSGETVNANAQIVITQETLYPAV